MFNSRFRLQLFLLMRNLLSLAMCSQLNRGLRSRITSQIVTRLFRNHKTWGIKIHIFILPMIFKTEIIFFVRTGHLSRFPYGGSIYKNNTYCGPPQHVRMPNVAIRPPRAPFQAPVIPACPPNYNFYPPFPPANQFAHPSVYMPPQNVFPNMEDNGYYKQMQQFEDGIPGRGPRYRNQFSRPKVP